MGLFTSANWLPELTFSTQGFLRFAYALLMLGTLLRALPYARRFFLSERWGGYAKSEPAIDLIQNPIVMPLIMLGWSAALVFLSLGIETVPAAFVNLACCHYFFIWMRWRGVLRGMGAPGFMSYWLALAIFVLELTTHHAPGFRPLAILLTQVDYALIMLSAGLYKMTAGYARNNGMELGMVNPEWGYWHRLWQKWRPSHPLFWMLNQSAWSFEVLSAILMLIPQTRFIGGLMMILSFVFIATQIRLCLLCEMVMVGGLLFAGPGTFAQVWIDSVAWPGPSLALGLGHGVLETTIGVAIGCYLTLLPLAHAGLFWNFYTGKRLRPFLQQALETYTNAFGIIIWRVFSADHTNFYPRVYRQKKDGSDRVLLSHYAQVGGRFTHVGECITLTSLFTTLKYYPSDNVLFRERVLRYARTLPIAADEVVIFEYVSIRKDDDRFGEVPVAEFEVDLQAGTLIEMPIDDSAECVRKAAPGSPVRAGTKPGSYAA